MNILIELVTARVKSGAGEYLRRVLFELTNRIQRSGRTDARLFALYDSDAGIAYDDLREKAIEKRCGDIPIAFVDCHGGNLAQIVAELKIDVFFIACAQYVGDLHGTADVNCRVVMTLHDISLEDMADNRIQECIWLGSGIYDYKRRFRLELLNTIRYLRLSWHFALRRKKILSDTKNKRSNSHLNLRPALDLFLANPDVRLIADSHYTLCAMQCHYGITDTLRMTVLHPPGRIYSDIITTIQDEDLRGLLLSRRRYFLMVSANRELKNPRKAVEAFRQFCRFNDDIALVAVGYEKRVDDSDRILTPKMLSDSDLEHAYENCFALIYPSVSEGYGYPPLEAMKFGKPVLASNVTSIPEVLGDSPLYFSPFYTADIFKAMMAICNDIEYSTRSAKSRERYEIMHKFQERDLESLLDMILEDDKAFVVT